MTRIADIGRHRKLVLGRRRCPRLAIEIEEIVQVWLLAVPHRQGTKAPSLLHKVQHGSVVHGDMANVMSPRERRDDEVRNPEAELSGETVECGGVGWMSSRINRPQIAVVVVLSVRRKARAVSIRIDGDAANVAFQRSQGRIGINVRATGNRRDVVVYGPPASSNPRNNTESVHEGLYMRALMMLATSFCPVKIDCPEPGCSSL